MGSGSKSSRATDQTMIEMSWLSKICGQPAAPCANMGISTLKCGALSDSTATAHTMLAKSGEAKSSTLRPTHYASTGNGS